MIRVLVVDDSKVMRDLVGGFFESLGVEVSFAESAEDGLWSFQTLGPDLLVSDINMPGISGVELARRVKAQSRGRVKVLLISSAEHAEGREAVERGDADAFVAKPIVWKELEAAVARLLPATEPGAQRPIVRARSTISVVIADDTEVGRRLLARTLSADPELEIVESVDDGESVVAAVERLRPRLVLLDVLLPRLDAPEVTRRIMHSVPTRVVVLTRDADQRSASVALEATRAGALDVLIPPAWGDPMAPEAVAFRDRLKELADIPVVRRWRVPDAARKPDRRRSVRSERPAEGLHGRDRLTLVAVCGSTGGPAVLAAFLSRLGPHLSAATVLVVQHVLAGFAEPFATWLGEAAGVTVRVARDADAIVPGAILIAPDGRHLLVGSRTRIEVRDSPPIAAHRPSGTLLFESAARVFGPDAIAVILTGMGEDGVAGLRTVKARGGLVVAQSPESCVVPGMPAAAIAEGLAHVVASADDLADEVLARLATADPSRRRRS